MQATLASGRHCDDDDCFVFELREGRIARVREYMDTQKGRTPIFS
jgi:ketosteroid isomerase-like protein